FYAAVIKEDRVIFQKAYGWADVDNKVAFSSQSQINIASISKTFIGLSLMKLVEAGKLKWGTKINEVLSFPVNHPKFPNIPLTIQHLATHTSGIYDYEIEYKSVYLQEGLTLEKSQVDKETYGYFARWAENQKLDLESFLKEALLPEGKYYAKKRFTKEAPGAKYLYSNLGAALGALLVEKVSNLAYEQFVREKILTPLDLNGTYWRHRGKEPAQEAKGYFQNGTLVPQYQSILYPSGGLMASGEDLSKYLMEILKGYQGKSRFLPQEAWQEMLAPQLDKIQKAEENEKNVGRFWEINGPNVGHNGGNYGTTCFMWMNPKKASARIFLCNISSYEDRALIPQMLKIWRALTSFEESLAKN
ncbi:MAG: serine hydrolase domain-containing protein, partial [Bacteroidota bacterium]